MTAVDAPGTDRPSDGPSAHPGPNERAYRAAIVAFGAAIVGGAVAAIAYWFDHPQTLLGCGLAVALFGIGFGMVAWAKYLDLDENATQQREPLRSSVADERALHETIVEPGHETAVPVHRRRFLAALLAGSFASLVVGFVGPIGSLGPKPRGERGRTGWSRGSRLVTADGEPIEAQLGGFDQLATVFPEGMPGRDDSQVVLLRLRPDLLSEGTVAHGAIDGWVAYSKICTHAGCSVGLFGIDDRPPDIIRELVCPCHQSAFDPADRARPVGGPAPRPLPQLPLAVDADGFLVAAADFDGPVGPIAWDEG